MNEVDDGRYRGAVGHAVSRRGLLTVQPRTVDTEPANDNDSRKSVQVCVRVCVCVRLGERNKEKKQHVKKVSHQLTDQSTD